MDFYCVKNTFFIWKNYFFDKAIKLVDGAIKPLQFQTTLKVLQSFRKRSWRNSLALILMFQVAIQNPGLFSFTDVYKFFIDICEEEPCRVLACSLKYWS